MCAVRRITGTKAFPRYYGPYDSGAIKLEFATHGQLTPFVAKNEQTIDLTPRHSWVLQLASALEFIHRLGVVHGDFSSSNIFLDENKAAKIGDFSGSSLDGSELLVYVGGSYAHPTLAGSQKGDIFAYGSTVFEIVTGAQAFADLEEHEVEKRFAANIFPETKDLGSLEPVVRKCWNGEYEETSELLCEVQGIIGCNNKQHVGP